MPTIPPDLDALTDLTVLLTFNNEIFGMVSSLVSALGPVIQTIGAMGVRHHVSYVGLHRPVAVPDIQAQMPWLAGAGAAGSCSC